MISTTQTAGRSWRFLGILALLALFPAAGLAIALETAQKNHLPGRVVNACLAMMGAAWDLTEQQFSVAPLTTVAVLFVAGSFLYAVLSTGASLVNTRRLLYRSRKYIRGRFEKLDAVLTRPQFRHLRLRLLESPRPLAFTVGLWHPQLVLSEGMISTLSPQELAAVLFHELGHVQSRDPLRLAVVRFLAGALWFLPVARSLAAGFADAVEAAADDWAVAITRQPVDLASALVKTARAGVQQAIPLATPLAGHLTVEDRVERLLGVVNRKRPETTRRRWVASGFIAALLMAFLVLPHARSATQKGVEQAMATMPLMNCHVSQR
ncbi:MAG: M56 family metallopeptidase [Candidatus Methylomirabilales bacterium]